MSLPTPGPGRPEHPSYYPHMQNMPSLFEFCLVAMCVAMVLILEILEVWG